MLNAAALREGGSGTLIISVPTAPDIFDPHATGGWDTYKHTLQMFEGLSRENLTDPNSTFTKGHFALQGHDPGTVVTFRKIEMKEIK